MQQFDLGNGRRDIPGVGIGHRLHHDRRAAAYPYIAHAHRGGFESADL